jgi:transcriptional regulator with XRE-family HTH domain
MKPKAPRNPRAPKAVDIFVGSRIRHWRMRRKMTQEGLAKFLDLSYGQIQQYEKGTNRVAASRLNDIANALNVPIPEFFAGARDAERRPFAAPEKTFDPQAFRIAEAFVKISDKETRKLLIQLVETMVRKLGGSS